MVYELQCAAASLDVHVLRQMKDGEQHGWRVEAHDGHVAADFVVTESASTRAEALRQVGAVWNAQAPRHGIAAFDWDAIALLLSGVRAL